MSTKAIREALERIQCTCRDHSCVGCRAEAAVSAIERAAKGLNQLRPNVGWNQQAWDDGLTFMESIAKDAP